MNRRVYPRLMVWPVLLALVLLVGPAWGQAVVYVDAGASGAGDGSSWADAFTSVQAGLAAAVAGDQVWVAAGRYVENITLVDGVALYGGFAGDEDPATFDLAERDFGVNETILDGNQAGSVVTAVDLADERARIDGFTITNGRADHGGGLHLSSSSPTITNNTITGNRADEYGGGLYAYECFPMIAKNTIMNNSAWEGGGLYLGGSSPTIVSNVITGNSASEPMYPGDGGGGGLYLFNSSPTIANNTIAGNSAGGSGGGLLLGNSSPTIVNNIITGNSAVRNFGGGLYLSRSSPTISNNTITNNCANYGGGLYVRLESSPTIANTIIAFNSSGVRAFLSDPVLRHNCVYGNVEYDYFGVIDPTGMYGNISEDPLFADRAYGNWHIQPDSPCVDAGDNEYVLGEFDVDGEPRIQPVGGTVDIGADESDGSVWPAGPYVIVRVRPEGDDENDGSSWSLAKRTVQAAIDGASELGGDVWVAAGTYCERIMLLPHAHVYGGFVGSETERNQRDWVSNMTVLDGQQEGSVVTAGGGGGASALDGFTVTNGYGEAGGGVCLFCASPTIANNTIMSNSAEYGGGGLYLRKSYSTIANNTIRGNSAGSSGGGLFLKESPAVIVNTTIRGNSAGSDGGGLFLNESPAVIVNNAIRGNSAGSDGGGLYLNESSPTTANNTITNNSARHGGGLYAQRGSPTIANTIVAFNSSGVVGWGGAPILRHNCVYGNAEYDYSGLGDPTGADGNISEDPLFVLTPDPGPDGEWGTEDDEPGDLRLSGGSPCIDAGDNAYVPEFVTTDLDGNPRFVDDPATPDTGTGGWPIVDMGAYEYQFRPADLNCDGLVNTFDIDPFVLALTSAFDEPPFAGYLAVYPGCNPLQADINGDGAVNVFDIDPFVQCLTGGGCPTGACCLAGGCQERTQAACMGASWSQWLEGETCEPYPCPAPAGMTLIPAGEFMMGDTFGEGHADGRELPVHAVYVDAFYIGVYEVTNAEYAAGLNWAWAQGGLITVSDGVVYQAGSGTSRPYCRTTAAPPGWPRGGTNSTITWDGTTFGVVAGKENHPVGSVSWFGAVAYCNWHSAREGRPVAYDLSTWTCDFGVPGYRLPTEAEWERAARGGIAGSRFAWADQDTIEHARANYQSTGEHWYDTSPTSGYHPLWDDGSEVLTSPVGFFTGELQEQADWGWPAPAASYQTGSGVNAYGLHDMTGNVWEWCHDWFDPTYYSSSPYWNPTGPASGNWRVLRGGSWYSVASSCRVAHRSRYLPNDLLFNHGLRIALNHP